MVNSESFGFLYIKNGSGQRQSAVPTVKNVGDDFYVVPTSCFNFIVSTKISKNAVDRNLIRRRLAEITRELLLTKNITGVFLAKKVILHKTYRELHGEVERLVGKI